ncbi:MAG: hypothetical protein ACRDZ3_07570 [Acidimicrobiia bacterium]
MKSASLLLGGIVMVFAAACDSGASDAAPKPADVPGEAVMEGLCRAAEAGEDAKAAEEDFARVHTDLHVVARALQEVDRGAAADFLKAKQKVEDDFRRLARPAERTPDLRRLITATDAGLELLEVTVTPCEP